MASFTKFEDIIAWQKARALTNRIFHLTKTGDMARDFCLRDQIRRATISIMANVAEGFDRYGLKEVHQFHSIAKASCAELRSHLYIALDTKQILQDDFDEVCERSNEVIRLISGLHSSIEKQCKET